jgi:hypothetical protein
MLAVWKVPQDHAGGSGSFSTALCGGASGFSLFEAVEHHHVAAASKLIFLMIL